MPDLGALSTLLDEGIRGQQGALAEARTASRDRERDVAAALDAATESVLRQREGRVNLPLLAWASGMGQPTRAGSFAESMSSGLGAAVPAIAADRKEQSEQDQRLHQFSLARSQLPHQGAMERLQMSGMPLDMLAKISPTMMQMRELELFQRAFEQANPGQTPPSQGGSPPPGQPPVPGAPPAGRAPMPGVNDALGALQRDPVNPRLPPSPPATGGAPMPLPPVGSPGAGGVPPMAGGPPGGPPQGAPPPEDGDPVAAQTVARWVRMGQALLSSGSAKYLPQAQALFSRAEAAARDGTVVDDQGVVRLLPGYVRQQVAKEVAILRAKLQTEAELKPIDGVTPGGTPITGTRGQLAQVPPGEDRLPLSGRTEPVLPPNSAVLVPAMPVVPADGGWSRDKSIPPGAVQKGVSPQRDAVMKEAGKYEVELTDQAKAAADIERQLGVIAHAYKQFTTGPYSDQRQAVANLAETLGFPELAEQARRGDAAAAEMAKKNILGLALKQLKEANSRFTQSEFNKIATEGSPSGEIRPAAAHAMLREALAATKRDRDLAEAWADAQKQGWQNPLAFADAWRKTNPREIYLRQADRQLGNFKGMDLPRTADDWVPGTVYVAPDRGAMTDKLKARGIAPGTMFRMDADRNFAPFTGFATP